MKNVQCKKMNTTIPNGRPYFGEEEAVAVREVLASGNVARGSKVNEFEEAVRSYCGTKYAVAVSSGTAALHMAALSLGLGPGKRCWTTPITFVATANCAIHAGAEVDFVDVNPETINIDIDAFEQKLKKAKHEGCLPDVVIPVHFAGQSCRMKEIRELGEIYNFKIIEDACHALGGSYMGKKIGSCRFSDASVLSFHPVKSISTGEGGMILTNDDDVYQRLIMFRHNGITKDTGIMTENHGPWYYEQHLLGFNYWLTDIQSAVGICQMKRLDEFIEKRNVLAEYYDKLLENLPVRRLGIMPDCQSARHLYVVCVDEGKKRDFIFNRMREEGIGVQVHYIPVPMQPYYKRLGFGMDDYPIAKKYYNEALSLPLFYSMRKDDVERIVSVLCETLLS